MRRFIKTVNDSHASVADPAAIKGLTLALKQTSKNEKNEKTKKRSRGVGNLTLSRGGAIPFPWPCNYARSLSTPLTLHSCRALSV